jgi:hypothetical protein
VRGWTTGSPVLAYATGWARVLPSAAVGMRPQLLLLPLWMWMWMWMWMWPIIAQALAYGTMTAWSAIDDLAVDWG